MTVSIPITHVGTGAVQEVLDNGPNNVRVLVGGVAQEHGYAFLHCLAGGGLLVQVGV